MAALQATIYPAPESLLIIKEPVFWGFGCQIHKFVFGLLPVHTSHALFHNASNLLKDIWVFFIDPMCQISPIIQDLKIPKA